MMKRRSFVLAAGGAFSAGMLPATAMPGRGEKPETVLWLGRSYLTNQEQFADASGPAAGERLVLRRRGDRRFDPRSIEVLTAASRPLGYLPPSSCAILAAIMDAGQIAFAVASPAQGVEDNRELDLYLDLGNGPLGRGASS